jgi:hypothetical protein
VGIFRKGNSLDLKYQLVKLDPSWQPKDGQDNKALNVMEEYARRVQKEDLLAAFIRSPHAVQVDNHVQHKYGGSHYVGSERCAKCHKAEYAILKNSKHFHAFDALINKDNKPSNRQFDPECVVCHTVGFRNPEGYNDLPRALAKKLTRDEHNKKLAHVGCESCHGPGIAHANVDSNDAKLHELMNPFRPSADEVKANNDMIAAANAQAQAKAAADAKNLFQKRMDRIETFCLKCHDDENDVNWFKTKDNPFMAKWLGLVHNSPANVGNRWLPPTAPAVKAADGKKQ